MDFGELTRERIRVRLPAPPILNGNKVKPMWEIQEFYKFNAIGTQDATDFLSAVFCLGSLALARQHIQSGWQRRAGVNACRSRPRRPPGAGEAHVGDAASEVEGEEHDTTPNSSCTACRSGTGTRSHESTKRRSMRGRG